MKTFLIVLITVIPILLTCVALQRVVGRSRRYLQAEQQFIKILQELSDQDAKNREELIQAEDQVDRFLMNMHGDARPLMGAIEYLAGIAEKRLSRIPSSTIIGILRYGSDRNRAYYAKKLLSEVDATPPANPRRDHKPSSPNSPGSPKVSDPSPASGVRSKSQA